MRPFSFSKSVKYVRPQEGRIAKGNVSPPLSIPKDIALPPYVRRNDDGSIISIPVRRPDRQVEIKTKDQIEKMRKACKIAREVLTFAGKLVKVSIETRNYH